MHGINIEGLIKLVKEHDYLYDVNHKNYKDANMKAAAWDFIGQRLKTNSEVVKHKWKTVRDGYIKYKKVLKQSEESGKRVVEYKWSSHLSFMDNYSLAKRANLASDYALQPHDPLDESNGSPSSSSNQWKEKDEPSPKRRKTIGQGDVDQILNFINSAKSNSNDAVDHLFMSYAETFKKFSPRRQAEMKIELAKLFSNAELNQLQDYQNVDNSQTHNTSQYLFTIKDENI